MQDVSRELRRLGRAFARAQGRRTLAVGYLLVLALLVLLAWLSRQLGPWPPFDRLEGRWGATLWVGAGLFLALPLLQRILPFFARPSPRELARRLDDQRAWADATDTALSLGAGAGADGRGLKPVEAFLGAQTAGRLRGLEPTRIWKPPRWLRWPWRLLVLGLFLLFFVALLGPGVSGRAGRPGAGRGSARAPGTDEKPASAIDANEWLHDHARLYLTQPEKEEKPLGLRVRLRTDRPLPAPYRTTLHLRWDDLSIRIAPFDLDEGAEVKEVDLDLADLEALGEHLTPGRHLAQARLVPREGPWTADLESNEVEVWIEENEDGRCGGGGGGEGEGEEPDPEESQPDASSPDPEPPEEKEAPPPEPEEDTEPQPRPEGEEPTPPEPPSEAGPIEVVDPFVRDPEETVEKEDAVVAVPDPDAGLESPPRVSLEEALEDLERVVERAMGDERIRPADRAFLHRYFRTLRELAGAGASAVAPRAPKEKAGGAGR